MCGGGQHLYIRNDRGGGDGGAAAIDDGRKWHSVCGGARRSLVGGQGGEGCRADNYYGMLRHPSYKFIVVVVQVEVVRERQPAGEMRSAAGRIGRRCPRSSLIGSILLYAAVPPPAVLLLLSFSPRSFVLRLVITTHARGGTTTGTDDQQPSGSSSSTTRSHQRHDGTFIFCRCVPLILATIPPAGGSRSAAAVPGR